MTTFDIGGADVNLQIPDDAIVTGAIVIATYQRIDDGKAAAGCVWGVSPIPHVQAVGMMRLATTDIERTDG